uniref:Fibronectin type-III domain-containing protein n=1 Tax=Echeneis naucrates TaxID=173247 RepID=A0A665UBF2_ECHNA
MSPGLLLLLLCLAGCVLAKDPDVDCLVVHLKYVSCSWNKQGPPEVNYTFQSSFSTNTPIDCATYMSENNINVGCNQSYEDLKSTRFSEFTTILRHGNQSITKVHHLKNKVLLEPPVNLTVKNGSDFNLWFYWNQTTLNCFENEVRYRINNNNWEYNTINSRRHFCINLPSSRSRYELQVRSRIENSCGQSEFWSPWSDPVVWRSNNSTDINQMTPAVWSPVLYTVGAFIFIILVLALLHHERVRIIPITVVPKPSPLVTNIEDCLQYSKGLKGNFKAFYNEPACPVREYCPTISQSELGFPKLYKEEIFELTGPFPRSLQSIQSMYGLSPFY